MTRKWAARLQVIWSPQAEADLRDIWRWSNSEYSPARADQYLISLVSLADSLTAMPERARTRDDVRKGIRSILHAPYVVFFRLEHGKIQIVRVLHSRRDLPVLFE